MAAFVPIVNPKPHVAEGTTPSSALLVASGAYTATASQEVILDGEAEGIEFTIVLTTGGAPSIVPKVEAFDIASQTWVTLLTGAAIVATSTVLLLVSHHAPNVTNVSAAHVVREQMRITMTHADATAATYSITASSI